MIVIDIETTGLNPWKHQMISLGAVDFITGDTFYEECRIHIDDEINPKALQLNGFTEESIRDYRKQSPEQLYKKFIKWVGENHMLASCNISFDLSFLKKVHQDCGFDYETFMFRRNIDLYSISFCKTGTVMSLKDTCNHLGIEPEPEIHNALTGALKACECFKLLLS